ncbi:ligase-associated DNA damage response endonuclease PdeM [Olleya sp. YS]|uniref:ligase-associated DNA damage response endonuclease PdeM n=1 Tax=Olleya sp. YS TaxID=3028318 RepID=UPI0024340C63|nr:ligase-associated DNA damage response endonuclease PdeM [Olleya sp. YS]WGD36103.1 ligase-associated DNA damage response endonuclease PdeM [Olleya sp. YS]
MKTQSISIKNNTFILHPSGAVYWQDEQMLLIADVHFGKVTHFRKHGIAVPQDALYKNFERLDEVISYFKPKSLYFLGDLFHSYLNTEWQLFEIWANKQSCDIILVKGNHDIISPLLYNDLGIQIIVELKYKGFHLTHHPTITDNYFNFAGHIHPGITLSGLGKQRLTLPCFYSSNQQLILAAFGAFTGKHIMEPTEDNIIYAIADDEVIKITPNNNRTVNAIKKP